MIDEPDFGEPEYISGRASIIDIFHGTKRCGLYILHFENGEYYAGLAVDVARRYIQHRRVHTDIRAIQFRPLAKRLLRIEEQALIRRMEAAGHVLRNIEGRSEWKGVSNFDLIMSVEDQESWVNRKEPTYNASQETRVVAEELRQRYRARFQSFEKMPEHAMVINLLRQYVATALPVPNKSEVTFWTCSCLPYHRFPEFKVFSRINIRWQEVFTVYKYQQEIWASFHLASSPLHTAHGTSLNSLRNRFLSLEVSEHTYEPGGYDQINLIINANQALELMQDAGVISSMRLLNMRLMKKGPCSVSRFHCMDLADAILTDT